MTAQLPEQQALSSAEAAAEEEVNEVAKDSQTSSHPGLSSPNDASATEKQRVPQQQGSQAMEQLQATLQLLDQIALETSDPVGAVAGLPLEEPVDQLHQPVQDHSHAVAMPGGTLQADSADFTHATLPVGNRALQGAGPTDAAQCQTTEQAVVDEVCQQGQLQHLTGLDQPDPSDMVLQSAAAERSPVAADDAVEPVNYAAGSALELQHLDSKPPLQSAHDNAAQTEHESAELRSESSAG